MDTVQIESNLSILRYLKITILTRTLMSMNLLLILLFVDCVDGVCYLPAEVRILKEPNEE